MNILISNLYRFLFSLVLIVGVFEGTFGSGWHYPHEIIGGVFEKNYSFNGSVDFTDATIIGFDVGSGTISGVVTGIGTCATGSCDLRSYDGTGSGLDADLLDGMNSDTFAWSLHLSSRGNSIDPSTTTYPLILSNHANTPNSALFWYISTNFYNTIGGNAAQQAYRYNTGGTDMYIRNRYSGVWEPWRKVWHSGNDGAGSGLDADTASKFTSTRTNYKGVTDDSVAGQLMWKNYGNGHTIFDASSGVSPSGTAVNNMNPTVGWTASYPTLMGWNGANTYGVRVESARVADSAFSCNADGACEVNALVDSDVGTIRDNNGGWIRTYGATGWYSQTYGGGWYMTDSTYVRVYNAKNILTTAGVYAAGFYYNSDKNLKKDIVDIDSALDKVMSLEGVNFKWKKTNRSNIGFIAQDVEKVLPELVFTDNETGLKSVEYGNIAAVLVEAMKEQQNRIENQQVTLKKQQKQIDDLLIIVGELKNE